MEAKTGDLNYSIKLTGKTKGTYYISISALKELQNKRAKDRDNKSTIHLYHAKSEIIVTFAYSYLMLDSHRSASPIFQSKTIYCRAKTSMVHIYMLPIEASSFSISISISNNDNLYNVNDPCPFTHEA